MAKHTLKILRCLHRKTFKVCLAIYNIMHERVYLLARAFNLLTRAFKAIVNLFSYEKKVTLFLHKSTHRTILCKKNSFSLSIHFSFSSTTSVLLLHFRGQRCL